MPASQDTLFQFFSYCQDRGLPVAFYRLPQLKEVKVVVQKQGAARPFRFGKASLKASGFVFCPFNEEGNYKNVIIRSDIFCSEKTLPALTFAAKSVRVKLKKEGKLKESNRKQYEGLVRKMKKAIKAGRFEKIIAARVLKHKKPQHFDAVMLFRSLCAKYPAAFVSLVYTPQYGLWIGASPEILLEVNKGSFKTYALAGTKANTPKNLKAGWGEKEKAEHKFVSNYIAKVFSAVTKQKPVIKAMETINAGNLLHLRTTFLYKKMAPALWQKAVSALHPTPAVAGLPTKEAVQFIGKHELNPRAFYSGYLGPVNLDNSINLYVNLRCMQVLKHKLAIYVGCGITADSNPAAEWHESKIKTETLLNALEKSA